MKRCILGLAFFLVVGLSGTSVSADEMAAVAAKAACEFAKSLATDAFSAADSAHEATDDLRTYLLPNLTQQQADDSEDMLEAAWDCLWAMTNSCDASEDLADDAYEEGNIAFMNEDWNAAVGWYVVATAHYADVCYYAGVSALFITAAVGAMM